jgi:hypothetical protein
MDSSQLDRAGPYGSLLPLGLERGDPGLEGGERCLRRSIHAATF